MPFDAAALQAVLARMPTSETVRGFVFNAMLAHVADTKGPVLASGLQERFLKKKPNDLLSYPAHDFFKLMHACAEAMAEPAGIDEGLRVMGYASATGFFRSPMGKMLLGIVGRGDPTRLMANEPTAYATSFSFGKRKYERTGERLMVLTHTEDYLPSPYNVGALQGAFDAVEAKAREVVPSALGPDAVRYTITW